MNISSFLLRIMNAILCALILSSCGGGGGGGGETVPATPSDMTAEALSSSVILITWTDNSSNESHFRIERSLDGNNFTQLGTATPNTSAYVNLLLTASTTYYYRVCASNAAGDSSFSNIASATTHTAPVTVPIAPAALVATAVSSTAINLAWMDNSDNEDGFHIERSEDAITYVQVGTATANAENYDDIGLAPSTLYYYRVRATNTAGDSAYSNISSATTATPPLAAPANLFATAVTTTIVKLTWTDFSLNESGFKIERSLDGVSYSQIGTTTADINTHLDMGRSPVTLYYYRVRAYNGFGDSSYSNISSITTPAINIPRTGQVVSYETGTGDDGALQAGVAWPSPRFTMTSSGSGTVVTDGLTGLIWSIEASTPTISGAISVCNGGTQTWQGALDYVACLNANNYLGGSDWRVPNVNELDSLVNSGVVDNASWLISQGMSNVQANTYWVSTIWTASTSYAWLVNMGDGTIYAATRDNGLYVWPVRAGGDMNVPAGVPQTGQIVSYGTGSGDDGALQAGIAWPSPRFTMTSSGSGTAVMDGLTGLIWSMEASTPTISGAVSVCNGGTQTWQGALDYVACLNANAYLGHADWRLPNRREMRTLTNYGEVNSATWLNAFGQGFNGANSGGYWTSSTMENNNTTAWVIHMDVGNSYPFVKTNTYYVWPVRGGAINE